MLLQFKKEIFLFFFYFRECAALGGLFQHVVNDLKVIHYLINDVINDLKVIHYLFNVVVNDLKVIHYLFNDHEVIE